MLDAHTHTHIYMVKWTNHLKIFFLKLKMSSNTGQESTVKPKINIISPFHNEKIQICKKKKNFRCFNISSIEISEDYRKKKDVSNSL